MTTPRFAQFGFSLLAAASLCVACSSSDSSDTSSAQLTPDAALAQTECFMGLVTPSVKYAGVGCSGSESSSSVTGLGPESFDDVRATVSLSLGAPPTVGHLDLTALTVRVPTNGTDQTWNAPLDFCTATAKGSKADEDFGWIYFRIDISCTAPATPAEGNTGEPLALGNFTIVTFFTLPD